MGDMINMTYIGNTLNNTVDTLLWFDFSFNFNFNFGLIFFQASLLIFPNQFIFLISVWN